MDYGDFKDLFKRAASDKVLTDKACNNIAKNKKIELHWIASLVYTYQLFEKICVFWRQNYGCQFCLYAIIRTYSKTIWFLLLVIE